MLIKPITKKVYAYGTIYENHNRTNEISQSLIQSKPKFEGRLRYFATEGTHIEIDIHDQNELNTLKQIYKNYYHKTPKGYISAAEIVEAVLGKSAVYF